MPRLLLALAALAVAVPPASAQPEPSFSGRWVLVDSLSRAIDPWRSLTVEVEVEDAAVVLKRMWRGSREGGAFTDSVRLVPGQTVQSAPLEQWPDERHLGAYIAGDRTKSVASRWADGGRTLITESDFVVSVQQGERPVRVYTEYRLSPGGDRLDVFELRSTRPRPIHYVFARAN